jgi:hypothetical protein
MWRDRVGAHDACMFNSYEMTRALVAERQGTLHHQARQHRLARIGRRPRRTEPEARSLRAAVDAPGPPARWHRQEERAAA